MGLATCRGIHTSHPKAVQLNGVYQNPLMMALTERWGGFHVIQVKNRDVLPIGVGRMYCTLGQVAELPFVN